MVPRVVAPRSPLESFKHQSCLGSTPPPPRDSDSRNLMWGLIKKFFKKSQLIKTNSVYH